MLYKKLSFLKCRSTVTSRPISEISFALLSKLKIPNFVNFGITLKP